MLEAVASQAPEPAPEPCSKEDSFATAEKLPPKIYGIMAATTLATWGTLAGSYELFF